VKVVRKTFLGTFREKYHTPITRCVSQIAFIRTTTVYWRAYTGRESGSSCAQSWIIADRCSAVSLH